MLGYIKIPQWIVLDNVDSDRFINFISYAEYVEEDKISLDYLRRYFNNDRSIGLDIIDELSLRGFEFYDESNKFLPNYRYSDSEEIIINNGSLLKFKNMDFHLIGLGDLISRFNIKSDNFFNYIPITGFNVLTKVSKHGLIKNEFVKNKFLILPSSGLGEEGNRLITNNYRDEEIVTEKRENTKSISMSSRIDEDEKKYIDDVFAERKYLMFNEFCKSKQIVYLYSINDDLIKEYSNIRGVGKGKIKEIKNRLKQVNYNIYKDLNETAIYDIDKVKMGIEEYLAEQEIDKLFHNKNFIIIRDYCSRNNIVTLCDLSNESISIIPNLSGVGKKKYGEFINLLKISINDTIAQKELISTGTFNLEHQVYNKYKDTKISKLFELLSLGDTDSELLISDIQGKKLSEIKDKDELRNLMTLCEKLSSIKDVDEIVAKAYKELNTNEAITITARYYENMTLQETGEILELTRERARQIQKKALKKIFNIFRTSNLKDSIKLALRNSRAFSLEDLIKHLSRDSLFLVEMIKSGDIEYLNYFKPLDMAYFDNLTDEINYINDRLSEISDYGLIEDYLEIFENMVSDSLNWKMEYFNINEFLENFGFKIYGNYFSKQNLNYTNMLEIILKYHIKEPVRIDEIELRRINKLTKSIFNVDYSWTERNIDSKLRYLEEIILTDRKTFCHIDHLKNNIFLMNQIRDYIDSYLERNELISSELLFEKFKESCIQNEINNKLYLYSMIKYNFADNYNTSFGNTLTITTRDNVTKITNVERLERYINKNNGKVTKKKISDYFQWPRPRIENVINGSSKLFTFETEMVANIDGIFIGNEEINEFNSIVKDAMKDGWTTAYIIYNQMLFNEDLYNVLNRNNIKLSSTISNLIRKLYDNVLGHTNFLYYKESDYQNIYDVILSNFKEKTTRIEIADYLSSIGYKTATVGVYINNLIDNKIYKEIAIDELVATEEFIISDEVTKILKDEIILRTEGKEYISLNLIRNYRRNLPNIDFRWNPYVIRSILEDNGFKRVIRRYSDYRNECVIILLEKSKINYFDELVYYLLRNNYDGNLHEKSVYEYLVSLGLLKFQEYSQNMKLPYEIVNSDLFSIDNTGRITLKEVNDK